MAHRHVVVANAPCSIINNINIIIIIITWHGLAWQGVENPLCCNMTCHHHLMSIALHHVVLCYA
jgi:hypothetical protein